MPKKIDHEARKEKILQASLKVFGREGYKDSNMSLISEECNLSRATIYQYFKDKEQIYYYAVKLVTGRMFEKYSVWAWNENEPIIDRMINICNDIMEMATVHISEVTNLVAVMLQLKKENRDFSDIIMRRTAKLGILFKRMLRDGIQDGEVKPCDIDLTTRHIIILLESYCFQISLLSTFDLEEAQSLTTTYLNFLRATPAAQA